MEVTVGIPVHNGDQTIARAIDSVLSQYFDHPYEVIVVDDGSTDLTAAIVREYEYRFPRLIRYVRQPKTGVATARNLIVEMSKGRFITWLDSDDWYLPFKLSHSFSTIWNAVRTEGHENIIAYGDYIRNSKVMSTKSYLDAPLDHMLTGVLNGYLWSTMGSRSIYAQLGEFRPDLQRCEDLDFFIRFIKSGGTFVHVSGPPQVVYNFKTSGRPGRDVEYSFEYLLNAYARDYELLPEYKQYASRRMWEISNFYEAERSWGEMWRCRGKALTLSFEDAFPKLISVLNRETNQKLAALEKRLQVIMDSNKQA